MSRIQYTEQQSFRQVLWIWLIIIPIAFLSSLGILFGFYQQLILGEPWGNEPMSDGGMITVMLVVSIVQVLVIWFVSSISVSIEITGEEFRYKFFARFTDWNVLTPPQITGYSLEKYSFWKARGLGYRKDIFRKTVSMIIKPDHILSVKINDGRTIMISTENKEELERAMQKLMSKSENF
jgi:hypothetical protein